MENKERFVIELFLGLILIIFLLLMTFFVIGNSHTRSTETYNAPVTQVVTNVNAKTNNYNYDLQQPSQTMQRPIFVYTSNRMVPANTYFLSDYNHEGYNYDYMNNHMDNMMYFNSYAGTDMHKGVLGNDVKDYNVYVQNPESKGGYFEVTFYFKDSYGNPMQGSETKYIYPGSSETFFYRDIYAGSMHNAQTDMRYQIRKLN